MATETKIARVAFMDRGVYSAETEYSKWDFVTTEDSTYLYIGETSATGKPVTDTAYWKCIADGKQATAAAELADTARTELTIAVNAKMGEADGKIEEMNTTLSTYDGRVTQVESDIDQFESDVKETTEKPTAQSLSELNARITALEAILSNKIKDRIDVTKEFNVWGKTNLILYGDGASTKAPDFIGQTYIDTTNGNVYIAVGNSNAGNWKLV